MPTDIPSGDLTGSVTYPGKGKYSDVPGLPGERLQHLIESKDFEAAREHGRPESWQIIDGVLVVFDEDAPPAWLKPVLDARDEDGNTRPSLAAAA